jgi:Lipid A 3-O-deacylase (PagL)
MRPIISNNAPDGVSVEGRGGVFRRTPPENIQMKDWMMRRSRIYVFITMTTLLTGAQVAAAKMVTPSNASLESQASHVGFGYYFIDNISHNLEGVGYFIEHANTTGGGLDLVPRWHYLKRDHWSLYLEGGAGFIYTRDSLRDPGTRFNFTLQGGAGATYDVTDCFTAMGGARWSHISNADIQGPHRNVGFDSPMFYLGLMMPW